MGFAGLDAWRNDVEHGGFTGNLRVWVCSQGVTIPLTVARKIAVGGDDQVKLGMLTENV